MTWEQAEAMLGAMMAETAAIERARARKRDGKTITDAMKRAMPLRAKAPGGREWSSAGIKARELALTTTLNGVQIAIATGLSLRRAQVITSQARGKPGQMGNQRSPASFEAERLLREGATAREAAEATGLSRSTAMRLAAAIRDERKAA